ncbi:MAG: NAD(P)/FAD-dependent oxidoreductase [Burkholderiales bacterium]
MNAAPAAEAHPESYWAATAGRTRFDPLTGDSEADVAVIGGGFTGLAAAYELNRLGRDCVVLEAHDIGWGASGRNGGMVVPRYKHTYPALAACYGEAVALAMHAAAHRAVDTVESIVAECAIDCGFARHGHLTPMVHASDEARFAADAEWLARYAGDAVPAMLSRADTARRIGTDFYRAAYYEPRGAGIHPFAYCAGLAVALAARGVRIHTATPALEWHSDGNAVTVSTPRGTVRAHHLVLATNGYTDLTQAGAALKLRIVPMVSSLIATEPLPSAIRERLLPAGHLVTDAKRLTNYFRLMPDGALLFGGRGGASNRTSTAVYRRLAHELANIFPALAGTPLRYRWSGRVAVTLDGLPHIGALGKSVSYALGYNGRGVALSALLGRMLAHRACGEPVDAGPMSKTGFGGIPLHALRVPAKQLAITYYRLLDAIGA